MSSRKKSDINFGIRVEAFGRVMNQKKIDAYFAEPFSRDWPTFGTAHDGLEDLILIFSIGGHLVGSSADVNQAIAAASNKGLELIPSGSRKILIFVQPGHSCRSIPKGGSIPPYMPGLMVEGCRVRFGQGGLNLRNIH